MTLSLPKQNPSMISLEGLPLGQYNVEMCSVPVVVCIVIVNCSFEVAPLVEIGLTTSKMIPSLTSIATPPPCLFGLSALAIGWQPGKNILSGVRRNVSFNVIMSGLVSCKESYKVSCVIL